MADDISPEQKLIARIGAGLTAAATPTPMVKHHLDQLSVQWRAETVTVAQPKEVFVVHTTEGRTTLAHSPSSYRFDQTAELFTLVEDASSGSVTPREGLQKINEIDTMAPTFGAVWRYFGFLLLIVGLGLAQHPGVNELIAVSSIGTVIAAILLTQPKWGALSIMAPVTAAFVATAGVELLLNNEIVIEPTKVVTPLLAAFIPGASLAVGTMELAKQASTAGAGRLMEAFYQLAALALGIVIAFTIFPLKIGEPDVTFSWWVRPVGVALYALGCGLAFSASRRTLWSLVPVVLGAWLVQQILDLWLPGYLPGMVAGATGVLIAQGIYYWYGGAPPLVTLNPIFRLVAPGGLSLLGFAAIAAGEDFGVSVGATIFSFIAVSIGMAVGLAISKTSLTPVLLRRTEE